MKDIGFTLSKSYINNNLNFTAVVLKLGSSTLRSKNSAHEAVFIITTKKSIIKTHAISPYRFTQDLPGIHI